MSESNQFAVGEANDHRVYIENGSGYDVAVLDRLAIGDTPLHANVAGTGVEVEQHATTDAEWQSIIDLIAAAPEMLSVIREYQREARACGWGGDTLDTRATNVLAKAEPPRKHRVRVTVEVEVVGDGGDLGVVKYAASQVYASPGVVFVAKTATLG